MSQAPILPLAVFDCPLEGVQLVEASAGTGKTWNICALYLRLLLERDIEAAGILVVTFSLAATAELRERIRDRLVITRAALRGDGKAAADPFVASLLEHLAPDPAPDPAFHAASLLARLDRALESFDEAAIHTIHGFCQRALADAPFGARLPLRVEQADDSPLVDEIATDFWRQQIVAANASPLFATSLAASGDSPERWARALRLRLGRPLSRLAWPEGVEDEAFNPDALDTAWQALAAALAAVREHWQPLALGELIEAAQPRLSKTSYSTERVADSIARWQDLLDSEDPLTLRRRLANSDLASREQREQRLRLLGRAHLDRATKKGQAAVPLHPFQPAADAFLEARAAFLDEAARQRLRLLRRFLDEGAARLRAHKRERRQIAFDDMLSNLHRRLHDLDEPDSHGQAAHGPALAALLRQRFPAALIDEFQDTDPQQFAIFERIYGDSGLPLFFVGDPKQAIYAFRGADLPTYLDARRRARACYTLTTNQRATPPLIAALEALLTRNERGFVLEGLAFQTVTAGNRPRAPFEEAPGPGQPGRAGAALRLWQLPDEGGLPTSKAVAVEAAARACAAEVVRLLDGGQAGTTRLGGRPLEGGDIAILVPKHAFGRLMRRCLAERGVASVELSQESVFASSDAEDLARVLAAMNQPSRRGLVLSALATDAMGADAAAVAAIIEDNQALAATMTRFAGYRDAWRQHGIAAVLRRWMREEGVESRLLGRPDGERRMTNLMHLAEALQQASLDAPGPEALLRWFDSQRRGNDGLAVEAAQLRLESDRHLVQILTIHRSKGLEYPIVFCPFSWDGRSGGQVGDDGQAIHDADGRGVITWRALTDEEALYQRLEEAAEQVRLLYVALTRAVHRCYLVVGCYRIARSVKEAFRSPLNWLVAGSGHSPADWFGGQEPAVDWAAIQAAWRELAANSPADISIEPLPRAAAGLLAGPAPDPGRFVALPAPASIPGPKRIGSYSSLTQGSHGEGTTRDHDLFVTARATGPGPEADDILNFARGPVAGECLHLVFEHADFGDETSWPGAIDTALARFPQVVPAQDASRARVMLGKMLAAVVATPLLPARSPTPTLSPDLTLASIDRRHRLDEFEFTLPAVGLQPSALARLLGHHGYPPPAVTLATLGGWLRGFIDLVFEHDGRFYLLDWKSNHLGPDREDYGHEGLAQAMQQHAYHLQALLYTLALHRYLGQRLADYDYERHIGGVFYLFVRGVRPDWQGPDGKAAGVYHDRPSLELVEALDRIFAGVPG